MLAKFVIAFAALFTGAAVVHYVHTVRAKNFRHIAQMEAQQFELAGYERGWEQAKNSSWMRVLHYNEFMNEAREAK